ncbi:hypothetical protein FRC11_010262 [Ceratobasidium sp. 423]|nr:hypothetical protein FRC11_010262 [Ceratobasidium sp. 423]
MSNLPNETHSDAGSSVGNTTPFSSPRSPPTDSESDFSNSPTDSLFSDEPFEPNLKGPQPGEEPQYRGRKDQSMVQAPPIVIVIVPPNIPPAPVPEPAPAPPPPAVQPGHHHHAGGANAPVIQGVAPFNPAEAPPNHPDNE